MLYLAKIIATPLLFDVGLLSQRAYAVGIPSLIFVCTFLCIFRFIRSPKLFVQLGGASYALYLTHPYPIRLVDKLTGCFSGGLSGSIFGTLICFVIVTLITFLKTQLRKSCVIRYCKNFVTFFTCDISLEKIILIFKARTVFLLQLVVQKCISFVINDYRYPLFDIKLINCS